MWTLSRRLLPILGVTHADTMPGFPGTALRNHPQSSSVSLFEENDDERRRVGYVESRL